MTIEIRTSLGKVLHRSEAASLREAVEEAAAQRVDLRGADLNGTDFSGANLAGADLARADLAGADLAYANLTGTNFTGADLAGADLAYANLTGTNLHEANLEQAVFVGATMPDGRTWSAYISDPLAGICSEPEARERAIAAWGNHEWTSCPMHAAHGWTTLNQAPLSIRHNVAAFIALFDSNLLPKPVA
jgi:hypothetical protein